MTNGIDADLQTLLASERHYNTTTGLNIHRWALFRMCSPSVYQTSLHNYDQIFQAFPLCICLLQAIKDWGWEQPQKEANE